MHRNEPGYESPAMNITHVTVESGFAVSTTAEGFGIEAPTTDTSSESIFE